MTVAKSLTMMRTALDVATRKPGPPAPGVTTLAGKIRAGLDKADRLVESGADGTGAGLGLSIVAAIATTHHGTVNLHARPDGGLRVTVTLPLVARPALTAAAAS